MVQGCLFQCLFGYTAKIHIKDFIRWNLLIKTRISMIRTSQTNRNHRGKLYERSISRFKFCQRYNRRGVFFELWCCLSQRSNCNAFALLGSSHSHFLLYTVSWSSSVHSKEHSKRTHQERYLTHGNHVSISFNTVLFSPTKLLTVDWTVEAIYYGGV